MELSHRVVMVLSAQLQRQTNKTASEMLSSCLKFKSLPSLKLSNKGKFPKELLHFYFLPENGYVLTGYVRIKLQISKLLLPQVLIPSVPSVFFLLVSDIIIKRRPLSTAIFSATRLLQKKYGEGEVRTHDLLAGKQKN